MQVLCMLKITLHVILSTDKNLEAVNTPETMNTPGTRSVSKYSLKISVRAPRRNSWAEGC